MNVKDQRTVYLVCLHKMIILMIILNVKFYIYRINGRSRKIMYCKKEN